MYAVNIQGIDGRMRNARCCYNYKESVQIVRKTEQ